MWRKKKLYETEMTLKRTGLCCLVKRFYIYFSFQILTHFIFIFFFFAWLFVCNMNATCFGMYFKKDSYNVDGNIFKLANILCRKWFDKNVLRPNKFISAVCNTKQKERKKKRNTWFHVKIFCFINELAIIKTWIFTLSHNYSHILLQNILAAC